MGVVYLIVFAVVLFAEIHQHDSRLTIAWTVAVPVLGLVTGVVQLGVAGATVAET